MNSAIRTKLCIMMVLEYMVWGAWLPLLGLYLGNKYLNFTGTQTAWVFNAFAIASLTGMFFGGQLADRYFAQEKFLAFSHLIGGISMLAMTYQKTFWPIFGLMLLHCFFYVPTLSVTNAITFANLKDSKDFGLVRAFGTIGWILAGLPFFFYPTESLFTISGIFSLILAGFCLTLPHTPPVPTDESSTFAPLKAIKLLAVPTILILFIVTFLDSLVHYCYFFWTSRYLADIGLAEKWIPAAMSIGQFAEIATMAYLAYFLKALGWRKIMILGILGHVVRFGIYSIGTPDLLWLVILSNVVHGFAYAFFFATVYIFVDENFPKDVRTSAQSLFNFLVLGAGPFLGNFIWGWLGDVYSHKAIVAGKETVIIEYHRLFLAPLAFGVVAALFLIIFFHPGSATVEAPVGDEELAPTV
jgi:nucleoside transporter